MFWRTTISQTGYLLRKKNAVIVFYVLLAMVLFNFIRNVVTFQGRDVLAMYQPMKLLLLSYNRTNYNADMTILLIQLYPLLVVCPAGFSLAKEYQTGENVYMSARLGGKGYKYSKMTAAFLATAIIFCVPFLIEIALNCVAFPLQATGDLSNWGYYEKSFAEAVHNYLFSGFYLRAPYLYAVAGTLLFGILSGLLGAFTVAVSSVVRVKYNVFLFLPVFLLLNLSAMLSPSEGASFRWYDFFLMFNEQEKNIPVFAAGLLAVIIFSVAAVITSSRKDCL